MEIGSDKKDAKELRAARVPGSSPKPAPAARVSAQGLQSTALPGQPDH